MKISKKEKELILSKRECQEGYHICPETGECVPIGQRRGGERRREARNLPSRLGKEIKIPPLAGQKLPDMPTMKELKKK